MQFHIVNIHPNPSFREDIEDSTHGILHGYPQQEKSHLDPSNKAVNPSVVRKVRSRISHHTQPHFHRDRGHVHESESSPTNCRPHMRRETSRDLHPFLVAPPTNLEFASRVMWCAFSTQEDQSKSTPVTSHTLRNKKERGGTRTGGPESPPSPPNAEDQDFHLQHSSEISIRTF